MFLKPEENKSFLDKLRNFMYLPEIFAIILPQAGLIIFFLVYSNSEINTVPELNLMIYSFWIYLAIPGLISGILTRNSNNGFEITFLSGIIVFPILANSSYILGFILKGSELSLWTFIIIIIFGIIIGIFTGCFGYIGGWIGSRVFSYSYPKEKRPPFEIIKQTVQKIIFRIKNFES
ncbi:MAG: hypothetical protein ACFFB2_15105 [Promethearchaeota archaeon]